MNLNLDSSSSVWARESYEIVTSELYSGLVSNDNSVGSVTPSKEYLDRSQAIAERQLAIGGYRLAYTL